MARIAPVTCDKEEGTANKDLQQKLEFSDGQIQKKNTEIAASHQEIQKLQLVTQKKDGVIEDREKQLQELNQQLASYQQGSRQLEQNLQQKEEAKQTTITRRVRPIFATADGTTER